MGKSLPQSGPRFPHLQSEIQTGEPLKTTLFILMYSSISLTHGGIFMGQDGVSFISRPQRRACTQ